MKVKEIIELSEILNGPCVALEMKSKEPDGTYKSEICYRDTNILTFNYTRDYDIVYHKGAPLKLSRENRYNRGLLPQDILAAFENEEVKSFNCYHKSGSDPRDTIHSLQLLIDENRLKTIYKEKLWPLMTKRASEKTSKERSNED